MEREAKAKVPEGEVRFIQIQAAPFSTKSGHSYSMYGLSEDGIVYRFDPKCGGWLPWPMKKVHCHADHKAGR